MFYCGDVFFFQAEDGMRGGRVTGVQTCALPICTSCSQVSRSRRTPPCARRRPAASRDLRARGTRSRSDPSDARRRANRAREIGRASCREREKIPEDAGELKNKIKTCETRTRQDR